MCPHRKGETYGGKLCCGELTEPYDAYEWSFVAVPAQRQAGVTKTYKRKEVRMEKILKSLESGEGVTLNGTECEKLKGYIENLKLSAKDGVYYRDSLTSEVLRLSATVQPEISRDTMEAVAKKLTVSQLKEIKTAFEKQFERRALPKPQLFSGNNKQNTDSNRQFSI